MATNDDWLALTTEETLEPDLPICDPHHHLWEFRTERVEPRYLMDELQADLGSGHNIVSTVFIECRAMYRPEGPEALKFVGEVEFVNGIAAMSASGLYGPTKVAAIVLAAGESRRMGGINKLLIEVDGVAMVVRAADAALASGADPVITVTGHEREKIEAALTGRAVETVHNPDYGEGMSTSLRAGLAVLPADTGAAVICLGDMPHIDAGLISRLIAAFDPARGRAICVPTYKGKRGNPVLWAARYFGEMQRLAGDVGARHLIGQHSDAVHEIECGDAAVTFDVDTPEALKSLTARS